MARKYKSNRKSNKGLTDYQIYANNFIDKAQNMIEKHHSEYASLPRMLSEKEFYAEYTLMKSEAKGNYIRQIISEQFQGKSLSYKQIDARMKWLEDQIQFRMEVGGISRTKAINELKAENIYFTRNDFRYMTERAYNRDREIRAMYDYLKSIGFNATEASHQIGIDFFGSN